MLKVLNVRLTNFMNIERAELSFPIDMPTMIVGENGSGKSAILCAIGLALSSYKKGPKFEDYVKKDQTTAKVEIDSLVNGSPLECSIIIDKKAKSPLTRFMSYQNEEYNNSECDDLLEQLNIGYFSKVIFSMQDEGDITLMTPTARASLLSKLLDFDFTSQVEELSDLIKDLNTKVSENKTSIKVKSELIDSKAKEIVIVPDQTFTEVDNLALQNELSLILKSIEDYDQKVEANALINEEVAILRSPIDQLQKDVTLINSELAKIDTDLTLIKSESDTYLAAKLAIDTNINTTKKSIEEALGKEPALSQALNIATNTVNSIEQDVNAKTKDLLDIVVNLSKLSGEVNSLTSDIQFMEQGTCPTCHKEIDQSQIPKLLSEKEHLESEISKVKTLQVSEQTNELNLRNNFLLAKKTLIDATSGLTSNTALVSALKNSLIGFQVQLEKLLVPSNKDALIEELTLLREKKLIDKAELSSKIDIAKASITKAEAKKIAISRDEKVQLKTKEAEVLKKINENTDKMKSILDIHQNNDRLSKEIESIKTSITEITKTNESLLQEIDDNTEAKKVLDKDLPQYLIVKTCDKLEKQINGFIKSVFPDMTIKMYQDKKGIDFFYVPGNYDIDPENKDTWINISMSSGMEKSALSVAWRVALASNYGLDILMLDECDAAATDKSSEKLLSAVLDSGKFSQVFVITHKKETRDALLATKNLQVYYASKGKFSEEDPEE